MKKYAIIVAGGSGSRMKSEIPKQFILLNQKPILLHTIEAFLNYDLNIQVVLVLPQNDLNYWNHIENNYDFDKNRVSIVFGGETRFHSVKNGLQFLKDQNGLVAIHDAVRPFITNQIIDASFVSAKENGSGVVAVPLKDSIRFSDENGNRAMLRENFYLIQTPQTFQLKEILDAFDVDYQSIFTDDASVYEHFGKKIVLVNGSYQNIKITTPEDLLFGKAILEQNTLD